MFRQSLAAVLVGAMLAAGAPAAQAGDGHRGWRGGHEHSWRGDRHDRRDRYAYRGRHYRHDYRHDGHWSKGEDYSDEILIGAGLVGLAIIAGSVIASSPPDPHVTWSDPQRPGNCETDVVSRELPDGSIQYGDRTRCY